LKKTKTIVEFFGLPGSGKTFICNKLAEKNSNFYFSNNLNKTKVFSFLGILFFLNIFFKINKLRFVFKFFITNDFKVLDKMKFLFNFIIRYLYYLNEKDNSFQYYFYDQLSGQLMFSIVKRYPLISDKKLIEIFTILMNLFPEDKFFVYVKLPKKIIRKNLKSRNDIYINSELISYDDNLTHMDRIYNIIKNEGYKILKYSENDNLNLSKILTDIQSLKHQINV
jgi:hypothetical protein